MQLHTDRRHCFLVRAHLILIAFLMILIDYLRKYAAYLGCCPVKGVPKFVSNLLSTSRCESQAAVEKT